MFPRFLVLGLLDWHLPNLGFMFPDLLLPGFVFPHFPVIGLANWDLPNLGFAFSHFVPRV